MRKDDIASPEFINELYTKLDKKYSKMELKLLVKLTFEILMNTLLENNEGICIKNFGTFRTRDVMTRSGFGEKRRLIMNKKITFRQAERMMKKINRKIKEKNKPSAG